MNLHLGRLNIGPRLVLGFGLIIVAMLVADAVVLWQFQVVRVQAERLSDIDQARIAVLRVHSGLLAFHDRLNTLTDSEDVARLTTEAGPLHTAVLNDIRRATTAVGLLPAQLQRDPTILPTLHVVQSTLRSQFEAITALALAGDWRAVHLRLANQIRPLESVTSTLVEKVDQEVGQLQAQTALNLTRVQRRVFVILGMTAVLTLLIAGAMGLAITRSVTQPLEQLVAGSRALARGEFEHQVAIGGDDELARLGHVFNEAAFHLRDLYATLQNREDRLRRVIDTIPAHAWSTLPDGSVDFINQRFLDFAGRSREDLVGWGWGSVLHPDDLNRFVDQWQAAVASGEPMEGQARVRRSDGEYRWLLIRNVPFRDESGSIGNWYGTAIDITERRHAEEELRDAREELARASQLTTMGEFAASIAHEINQPLAAIVTQGSAGLRWLKRETPDVHEASEAFAQIVNNGQRAADVIRGLRALAKKSGLQLATFDIDETIGDVLALTHGEVQRQGVVLHIDLAVREQPVLGDRVQLQQVLLNLILNAIDAMKAVTDRGRELAISSAVTDSGSVLISVRDSGTGLDPAIAERVFEPFVTTKADGLGMGLSICRSIIVAHGGRLWASPVVPHGTVFQFTVPVGVAT